MNDMTQTLQHNGMHKLAQVKCKRCKQILFSGNIQYIEIECPKCHKLQRFGRRLNNICIKH